MKELSENWAEPFRSIIHSLPPGAEAKELIIQDWVPGSGGNVWDNRGGKVTLVGDSAHPMIMCKTPTSNSYKATVAAYVPPRSR